MRRETNVNRSKAGSEKTSQTAQASRGAAADESRIAQRAYELFEQRGRQDGLALEDWLNAEEQLAGATGR